MAKTPKRDYDERFTLPEDADAEDVARALLNAPRDPDIDAAEREAEAEELADSTEKSEP
jgi:hypothetical protein